MVGEEWMLTKDSVPEARAKELRWGHSADWSRLNPKMFQKDNAVQSPFSLSLRKATDRSFCSHLKASLMQRMGKAFQPHLGWVRA